LESLEPLLNQMERNEFKLPKEIIYDSVNCSDG